MVDKGSNTQYSTRFFGQLPLVDGGALLHCEPMHAEALLSEVHPRKIAGLTATREGSISFDAPTFCANGCDQKS